MTVHGKEKEDSHEINRRTEHRRINDFKQHQAETASTWVVSLDVPRAADDARPLAETVADEAASTPYSVLEKETDIQLVHEVIQHLNPRERTVLSLRFGLDDGRERSLEEIAVKLRISREYVRQLQNRALKRLHKCISRLEAALLPN